MNAPRKVVSQPHRILRWAATLAIAWLYAAPPAHAQADASISGIVRDASSAGIEAATVHVKNLETGLERELQTDAAGRFHAPSLAVGSYELIADKPGFRPERRPGIVLVVGQHEEIDLTLQIGDIRQTVEVNANPDRLTATTENTPDSSESGRSKICP